MSDADYAAWGCPRLVWDDVASFAAADAWQDGIHTVHAGRIAVDLRIVGDVAAPRDGRLLPVFFSGAVSARATKRAPFFSGLQLAASVGTAAVAIADPIVGAYANVAVAWYAGRAGAPLPPVLLALLQAIAARCGELLLVGGSGGGFAALLLGAALGNRASVLAWNPQTDWIEYEEDAVRAYLAAACPGLILPADRGASFRDHVRANLRDGDPPHSLLAAYAGHACTLPRRVSYLQNQSDWHAGRHAAPFLQATGWRDCGDGFHGPDTEAHRLWFGAWGTGHAPPPRALLQPLFEHMLDPASMPSQVRTLAAAAPFVDAAHAPRALGSLAAPVTLHLEATMQGDVWTLRIHVGDDEAHPSFTYAFYLHSGRERIGTHWYTAQDTIQHHELPAQPLTSVSIFARDGFGTAFPARQVPVARPLVATAAAVRIEASPHDAAVPLPLAGLRVAIFGSCVSRDAFAFVPNGATLALYLARSSLASAFGDGVAPRELHTATENIESDFQRRMVMADLERAAPRLLSSGLADGSIDLVLLDLIDERFSLYDADDALLTVSSEFLRSGATVPPTRLLPPTDPRHRSAWMRGARRFAESIDPARVVINAVRWATHDCHGTPLADQAGIARNNALLAQMVDALLELGAYRRIDYPDALLRADPAHRWGLSPFHFIAPLYEHTVRELARLAGRQGVAAADRSAKGGTAVSLGKKISTNEASCHEGRS